MSAGVLCVHCGLGPENHPLRPGMARHHETGALVEAIVRTGTRGGCPGWEPPEDWAGPAALAPRPPGLAGAALWDLPDWHSRRGWRHGLGYFQVRTEGRCGEPSDRGLYAGVHSGYGGSWSSKHYRDSDEPGPPWREDDGNDGCGIDFGRYADYAGLEEVWAIAHEPEVAAVSDEAIFEHAYMRYGRETYYAPHDHCSHRGNVHVHWAILPGGVLPDLGPAAPPPDPDPLRIGGRPVIVLSGSIGFGAFRALHSGNLLDVGGGGLDGVPLISWPAHGGDNQRFAFRPGWRPPYVNLVARHSGRVWDVAGAQTAPGSPVVLWETHDQPWQGWWPFLLPATAGVVAAGDPFTFDDLVPTTPEQLAAVMAGEPTQELVGAAGEGPPLFVFVSELTTEAQMADGHPLVLDIAGAGGEGAAATIYPLHGGANQVFALA